MNISYNEYLSKLIVLKNIFKKLDKILNIEKYKKRLETIEEEANSCDDIKKENPNINYEEYYDQVVEMIDNLNDNYMPFYEMYLLSSRIDKLLNHMDETNYSEVSKLSYELIECLNRNPNSKEHDKQEIISNSFKILYNVICNERTLERKEIFDAAKKSSNTGFIENIGLLIQEDLNKLPQEDVLDIELAHRSSELGYNFFSSDVIDKVSTVVLGDKVNSYQSRKINATSEVLDALDEIKKEKNNLNYERREARKIIARRSGKLAIAHLKACSLLMLPVMAVVGGIKLGGEEYNNITTTRNLRTDKIIETSSTYTLHTYKYNANIQKCSPWRENENGKGYIRDVTEYEYKDKENSEGISIEEILKSVESKKEYTETKDELLEADSTTEPEIIVTETIEDFDDHRKSVGGSIAVSLSFILVILVADLFVIGASEQRVELFTLTVEKVKELLESAEDFRDSFRGRLTRRIIKERLVEIGDKIVRLKEDYGTITERFGTDSISQEDIKELSKYIKR